MSDRGQARRRRRQWILLWIVMLVLGLGWRVPALGFVVPVVMMIGMAGGFLRGRWVCGNLCPRGGFLDRVLSKISLNRPSPAWLRKMPIRWAVFAALMGFMVFRITRNPGSVAHWGRVFWMMCLITTSIGVVGGLIYYHRFWCTFCPVGTFANAVGGGKRQPALATDTCTICGLCHTSCPMKIDIPAHRARGAIADRDCIRCGQCAAACPVSAIR